MNRKTKAEKVNAYQRAYYKAHPEKVKAYHRAYYKHQKREEKGWLEQVENEYQKSLAR